MCCLGRFARPESTTLKTCKLKICSNFRVFVDLHSSPLSKSDFELGELFHPNRAPKSENILNFGSCTSPFWDVQIGTLLGRFGSCTSPFWKLHVSLLEVARLPFGTCKSALYSGLLEVARLHFGSCTSPFWSLHVSLWDVQIDTL